MYLSLKSDRKILKTLTLVILHGKPQKKRCIESFFLFLPCRVQEPPHSVEATKIMSHWWLHIIQTLDVVPYFSADEVTAVECHNAAEETTRVTSVPEGNNCVYDAECNCW